MSTTRWVIQTECDYGDFDCEHAHQVVVDPDNLSPERVERAGIVIAGSGIVDVLELDRIRDVTADAVRAFLSDPEEPQ